MARWAIWLQGDVASLSDSQLDDLGRALQPHGGRVTQQGRYFSIMLSMHVEDRGAATQTALALWHAHLPSTRLRGLLVIPL
jgi:hypothetical protein